jgi:phosphate starvation-inducible protein PhoH and related proteins
MNANFIQRELLLDDNNHACTLYGDLNKNLQTLEKSTGVTINARGTNLRITGVPHAVELVTTLLNQLYELIGKGYPVYSSDFAFGLKILESTPNARLDRIFLDKGGIAQN